MTTSFLIFALSLLWKLEYYKMKTFNIFSNLLLVLTFASFLNFSVFAHEGEEVPTDAQKKPSSAKISSFLHDLSDAKTYENYFQENYVSVLAEKKLTAFQAVEIIKKKYNAEANSKGFDVVNNRVRVVVEPQNPDFKLPEEYGVEETRTADGSMVQAMVFLNKLEGLAERDDVKAVREPVTAVTMTQGAADLLNLVPEQKVTVGSYLAYLIPIVGIIALFFLGRFLKKKF